MNTRQALHFMDTKVGRLASLMLFLVAFSLHGYAASPAPTKPEGFIEDSANIFTADKAAAIREKLISLHQNQGVSCYVATFSSLEGGIKQRTYSLMQNWIGNEPGILLAYSWGEELPTVMASAEFWRRYPTDEVILMMQDAAQILHQNSETASTRLASAVDIYAAGIAKMETTRQVRNSPFPANQRTLYLYLGVAVLVFVLLGWLLTRWLQRRFAKPNTYLLPEYEVNRRLGAPYSGGSMGQSSVGPPPGR